MVLTVEFMSPEALVPHDNVLRSHTPGKLKKLRKSICRFGILAPIVIDGKKRIIDGHARLAAALAEKMATVPVISTEGLNDPEVRALRLAMNRLQEEAKWNPTALKLEFEGLLKFDFDLELTGFDAAEIDVTLDIAVDAPGEVDEIEAPATNPGPAVSAPGDIWNLGHHRIGCGDSLDTDFVRAISVGKKAQVCFTDPPYNVPVGGHVTSLAKHKEFAMASGEMSREQFVAFLAKLLEGIRSNTEEGAVSFMCMDWRGIGALALAAEGAGFETLNLAVWVKTNPGMGSLYRSQHELVAVLKARGTRHQNNVQLGRNGRSRSNVWTYRGVNVLGPDRRLLYEHPTVKPVAMIADAIRDVSRAGDSVFDPFLGSGSTLIAAERTRRHCVGVEIEPHYVDLAIRRWEGETGRQAFRESDGVPFAELASRIPTPSSAIQESSHAR